MEALIKEEAQEASLIDTSCGSEAPSLSLLQKYSRYFHNENTDIDSDSEFLPDDTILREEFAQLAEGFQPSTDENSQPQSELSEMIEKLAEVRRCGPEGNSIFCTQEELDAIQTRYSAILDLLYEKSSMFDRRDSENEEQVDVGNAAPEEQRDSMKLLAERIVLVQEARDRFYEIEPQVREHVEQLELVERYKMESLS